MRQIRLLLRKSSSSLSHVVNPSNLLVREVTFDRVMTGSGCLLPCLNPFRTPPTRAPFLSFNQEEYDNNNRLFSRQTWKKQTFTFTVETTNKQREEKHRVSSAVIAPNCLAVKISTLMLLQHT